MQHSYRVTYQYGTSCHIYLAALHVFRVYTQKNFINVYYTQYARIILLSLISVDCHCVVNASVCFVSFTLIAHHINGSGRTIERKTTHIRSAAHVNVCVHICVNNIQFHGITSHRFGSVQRKLLNEYDFIFFLFCFVCLF